MKVEKDVYLIAGIPASGKDWYVDNNIPASAIVSFDKIRVEQYMLSGLEDLTKLSDPEVYQKAWEYCNNKKIDLMQHVRAYVERAVNLKFTPCICNTLLTRKSRVAMLNGLKNHPHFDYKFHAIFLTVDSETALRRNRERKDHVLSEEVMQRFLNGPQELPSLDEGFDSVKVVHNV